MSLSQSFVNEVRTRISRLKKLTNLQGIQLPQELDSTLSVLSKYPCEELDLETPPPKDSSFDSELSIFSVDQDEPFNRENYRLQLEEMKQKTSQMGQVVNKKIRKFKTADLIEKQRQGRILQELTEIRENIGFHKEKNIRARRKNRKLTNLLVRQINELQSCVDNISENLTSVPRQSEEESNSSSTKINSRDLHVSHDFENRTHTDCRNCIVF